MGHKLLVLAGIAAAAGGAYLAQGWPETERTRVRGTWRKDRGAAALAPVAVAAPAPAPEKPKAEPPKPEPPKPVRVRTIEDVTLPVAAGGRDLTFVKCSEIHVDAEGAMTWHGGGDVRPMKTFKMLGEGLRQRPNDPLVLVADAQTPWQTIRFALLAGQDNYVTDVYLGVASAKERKTLRILPLRQSPRSDDPAPTGDVFTVAVKASASGAAEVSVGGRPLADGTKGLAVAWAEWRKAHPALGDTKDPEKTKVLLDAPRSTPVATVVEVLDAMRAAGIETERYAGAVPARPK
jgi:biopolymer transport protein ExbD